MDVRCFDAVVFDLDGTLLDTLEDLGRSMNRVLATLGCPEHPLDRYRYFVGDGATALVQRAMPAGSRDEALEEARMLFLQDYGQHWMDNTKAYEGVEEMLKALDAAKIPMAILSNKPHDFTVACVKRFLPHELFAVVRGERPPLPRKPDPAGAMAICSELGVSPHRCLYVGDTAIDMATAKAAGMFGAGVLWGFRDRAELEAAGARALISHPSEITALALGEMAASRTPTS